MAWVRVYLPGVASRAAGGQTKSGKGLWHGYQLWFWVTMRAWPVARRQHLQCSLRRTMYDRTTGLIRFWDGLRFLLLVLE